MKQKRSGRDDGKVWEPFHCGSLLLFEDWTDTAANMVSRKLSELKESLKIMLCFSI